MSGEFPSPDQIEEALGQVVEGREWIEGIDPSYYTGEPVYTTAEVAEDLGIRYAEPDNEVNGKEG